MVPDATMTAACVLVDATLKAALVVGTAWVATLAAARRSSSVRHAIWAAGMVCVALAPLTSILGCGRALEVVPGYGAGGRDAGGAVGAARRVMYGAGDPAMEAEVTGDTAPEGASAASVPHSTGGPRAWVKLVFAFWMAGAALGFGRVCASVCALRRTSFAAVPVVGGPLLDGLRVASRCVGVSKVPQLLLGTDGAGAYSPMVWGVCRHTLLLPAGADAWEVERLQAAMVHELAHINRQDALANLLAGIVAGVYWHLPVVWWAARQMRLEAEQACDDRVLGAGFAAPRYAEYLLDATRAAAGAPKLRRAAATMGQPPLEKRLRALLSTGVDRSSARSGATLGGLAGVLAMLLVLSTARLAAQSASPPAGGAAVPPPAADLRPRHPGQSWSDLQERGLPTRMVQGIDRHIAGTSAAKASGRAHAAGPLNTKRVPPVKASWGTPRGKSSAGRTPRATGRDGAGGTTRMVGAPPRGRSAPGMAPVGATVGRLAMRDEVVRVFALKNARADDAAAAIRQCVASGSLAGTKVPRIVVDEKANSLIASGTAEQVQELSVLVSLLDVRPRPVAIDMRVVQVRVGADGRIASSIAASPKVRTMNDRTATISVGDDRDGFSVAIKPRVNGDETVTTITSLAVRSHGKTATGSRTCRLKPGVEALVVWVRDPADRSKRTLEMARAVPPPDPSERKPGTYLYVRAAPEKR